MSQPIQVSQGDTKTASAGGFDSNFFSQISGGNLAMALIMINKMMQLYMQLLQFRAQLTKTMLDVQLSSAQASAEAVKNADIYQAVGLISQGICEIAGAGISAISSAAGRYRNRSYKNQIDKLDNEATPLRSTSKTIQGTEAKGIMGSGVAKAPAAKVYDADALNKRIGEFKRGDFTHTDDSELDAEAFRQLKNNPTGFDNVRKDLSQQLKNKESEINNLQSQYNNALSKWDQISQSSNNLGRAAGSIASGSFQYKKSSGR